MLKIEQKISKDQESNLERIVSWDSNFENLKQSYYEISFGVSIQNISGKEIAKKQFVYRTDDINNPQGKRCVFNQDGSWHVCQNDTDTRWNDAIPEFEFWFNLVNKIDKNVTDEVFKKTIISNLDESGYFNQY